VECLVLNDEHFVVGSCEAVTFNVVEVNVSCLKARGEIVGSKAARGGAVLDGNIISGDDDATFKTFKFNVNLNTVELQGGKRERLARVLGEPEGEWYVKDSALARIAD